MILDKQVKRVIRPFPNDLESFEMTDIIQVENIQHSYQSSQEWMFQQLKVRENEREKKKSYTADSTGLG